MRLYGGAKMAVNNDEKLKKIDEKMAQLKAQRQAIVSREKTKAEKARTRRLIQNGALTEQYLDCKEISPESFKILLEKIVNNPAFSAIIDKAKKTDTKEKKATD